MYIYIICGRVFSYSSSDANNTYIETPFLTCSKDNGQFSCLSMQQQLYWLRKFFHHKKQSMKMVEKMFPSVHPSKSVRTGIPRCRMLCRLCTCRCPFHGSTAVCRDSKHSENQPEETLEHLHSSEVVMQHPIFPVHVVFEQGIAQFHSPYRNEYRCVLCLISDHEK